MRCYRKCGYGCLVSSVHIEVLYLLQNTLEVVYINVQTSTYGSRAARSELAARLGVGRGSGAMCTTEMYSGQASTLLCTIVRFEMFQS